MWLVKIREEINIQIINRISTPISVIMCAQFNATCLANKLATTVMFRLMSYWRYRRFYGTRCTRFAKSFYRKALFFPPPSSRFGNADSCRVHLVFERIWNYSSSVCVCLHPVIMHFVCCLIKSPLFDFQHKPSSDVSACHGTMGEYYIPTS